MTVDFHPHPDHLVVRGIPTAVAARGGPGSGFHGHSGRPGEIGGSSPGEGAGDAGQRTAQETDLTRLLLTGTPITARMVEILEAMDDAGRLSTEEHDALDNARVYETPSLTSRGGPGSGFYGHAGRPGEQGGSAPGDGGGKGAVGEHVRRLAQNIAKNYTSSIRNPSKRKYAEAYRRHLFEGGKEPLRPPELSVMAAQAVRLNLQDIAHKATPEWQRQAAAAAKPTGVPGRPWEKP